MIFRHRPGLSWRQYLDVSAFLAVAPLFSHTLFAVYLGVLMWVGLAMRRAGLLRVVGLRRAAD